MMRTPAALDAGIPARARPSLEGILVLWGAALAWALTADWIAGVAILVLWLVWRRSPCAEGPPVIALALAMQWVEVTSGLFYVGATGRTLKTALGVDHRPMVLIGLGSIVVLMLGLSAAAALARRPFSAARPRSPLDWNALLLGYVASVVLQGVAQDLAWSIPQLTQAITVVRYCRFAFLFLILRRLIHPRPRWAWIAGLTAFEIAIGFTGYFAAFRESLMMVALVFLEGFDRRRAGHWIRVGALVVLIVLCGLVWISIRGPYRRDLAQPDLAASRLARLEYVATLAAGWLAGDGRELGDDLDALVDRLWMVHYPALAVSRVPAVLPHENGALTLAAVRHVVTPRLFFPEKAALPSDSDKVRKYAGVWVAGPESGTSIAFGYAAEFYVDFGLPAMFVPIFLYGLLMGAAYSLLLRAIGNRELAVTLVTVVYWLCLSQFGRSFIKLLGLSGTLLLYLGGAVIALDLLLAGRRGANERRAPAPASRRQA
jgi:hypothetical protein